ncbi:MAG: 16S rRNA processing protein RimM [Bdellovibrionales bacterium]|nr:16S rRNA processing protein RimM [Bdellovibrionales bacterium]
MTDSHKYIAVGHVKDAQGIKGEVFMRLFAGQADWLGKLTEVRLKSRESGEVQTFGVLKKRVHKDGLVILLDGVTDRNRAEELKGLTFEIPESYLKSEAGETIYLHEVLGFQVHDKSLGVVGRIKGFSSNGVQDLLEVEYQGREVLIPFINEFIIKIDSANNVVQMNLPEGLCDLM